MYYIQLKQNPFYSFDIDLELDTFNFTIKWNMADSAWYLDIFGITCEIDIKGIKMAPGVNLLEPFAISQLCKLYIVDATGKNREPDFDNINIDYRLIYITFDDIE